MRNHVKKIYEVDNGSSNRKWKLDVLPSGSVFIIRVLMAMLSFASIIAQKLTLWGRSLVTSHPEAL